MSAGRDHRADVLSVEEAVRGLAIDQGALIEATPGREREAKETGCRAEPGQGDVAGRARKKIVKPWRRCPVVNYLRGVYQVSQERAAMWHAFRSPPFGGAGAPRSSRSGSGGRLRWA